MIIPYSTGICKLVAQWLSVAFKNSGDSTRDSERPEINDFGSQIVTATERVTNLSRAAN